MNWKTVARRVSLNHKESGCSMTFLRDPQENEVMVEITPAGCELRVKNRQLTAAAIRKWIYDQRRWIDPKNPKRKERIHSRLVLYSFWDTDAWESVVGAAVFVDRRVAARMKEHLEVPAHGQAA